MANDRYPQDDYYNRTDPQDYGRDYGSGRSHSYGSARDYAAAGSDRGWDDDGYGRRDYGNQRYGQREQGGYGAGGYSQSSYDRGSTGQSRYGRDDDRSSSSQRDSGYYQDRSQTGRTGYGQGSYDRGGYGQSGSDRSSYGQGGYGRDYNRDRGTSGEYRGSYASDGHRFEDVGRNRHADDDSRRGGQGYGRQPQGYNYEERGFLDRAGDEVRSWFGDEDAERRREADARRDEQMSGDRYGWGGAGSERDGDYHSWRRGQMDALDRDYDEYRQHNRSKFENEFSSWRTGRQGQRDLLNKIEEHQDVVGSDGEHVGTVDKVRGDRVILTKSDKDAGGHHHSFPSSWLQSVDGKVTLSKSASEAKAAWRDEERKGAMFQDDSTTGRSGSSAYGSQASGQAWGSSGSSSSATTAQSANSQTTTGQTTSGRSAADQTSGDTKGTDLNRSFSGTY